MCMGGLVEVVLVLRESCRRKELFYRENGLESGEGGEEADIFPNLRKRQDGCLRHFGEPHAPRLPSEAACKRD
jgi:hypothetical protein